MQASRRLIGAHLPFGVITKSSLAKLADVKLLILSSVNMMDEEEVEAIRALGSRRRHAAGQRRHVRWSTSRASCKRISCWPTCSA